MNKQKGYISDGQAILMMVGALLVIVGGVFAADYYTSRYSCRIKAEGMGLRSDFGLFTGCRVEVMDRLVPLSMIRITEAGKIIVAPEAED